MTVAPVPNCEDASQYIPLHPSHGVQFPRVSVVIVGGSIGGLATAHALLKVGIRVRVFERGQRQRRRGGGGIGVSDSGKAVLRALGIFKHGVLRPDVDGLEQDSASSMTSAATARRLLAPMRYQWDTSRSGVLLRKGLIPFYSAHWLAIYNQLLDTLPVGVVEFGKDFYKMERIHQEVEGGPRVRVWFNLGEVHCDADFLIGADGNLSKVYEECFGDHIQVMRNSGYFGWRGQVQLNNQPRSLVDDFTKAYPKDTFHVQILPKAHAVIEYLPGNVCNWVLFINDSPPGTIYKPKTSLEHLSQSGSPTEVDAMHAWISTHAPNPSLAALVRASRNTTFKNRIVDRDPLLSFHNTDCTAVLVGDAAHAASPHFLRGSNMALQDAYWLARAFTETQCSEGNGTIQWKEWFARYDALRVKYCADVVNTARWLGLVRQGLADEVEDVDAWDVDLEGDPDAFTDLCQDGMEAV